MRRGSLLVLAAILAVSWMSGCAGQAAGGGLSVREAWARPGMAGGNSAIYFVIDNRGGQDDTLLSAACNAASMVELHISQMDEQGNMTMEHQENVPVPGGETVTFEPGGLHVMMMGLVDELKPDDTITVKLTFQKAGSITVDARVREP